MLLFLVQRSILRLFCEDCVGGQVAACPVTSKI